MEMLKKVMDVRQAFQMLNPFVIKLLLIMFFVEFVKGALIVTILPVYMGTVLGLSAFAIGWSLSLQYIGDNMLRSPVGWIIDRFGYRWCMLGGVLSTFLSVLILSTQNELPWIITACLLLGIGTSPLWPAVISGATEAVGDQGKGTIMSIIYLAWLTGVGLGPVVINIFIHHSYSSAFNLLIGIMIGVIVVALLLPKHRVHDDETSAQSQKHKDKLSRIVRMKRYFNEIRSSLNVSKWFYPALFAQTFALGLLTPVLILYARTVLHLTPYEQSFLLAFGGAITVVCLIPVGRLVDRYGTRWFLHCGFLLSALTLIAFTYFDAKPIVYVLVAFIGMGYACIIPAWNALIAEAIPIKERGTVWGFFLTIEGMGMIVGPIVAGRLWDVLGYHAPFLASGIVLLLLFVFHIVISKHHKETKAVVR
jgi:DHA1 family multidrug resistance protein-like MFS transporter